MTRNGFGPKAFWPMTLATLALMSLCDSHAQDSKPPLGLPAAPAGIVGTESMRRLGERLFFDRSLSANGTLSCAMCHIPSEGYASRQSAVSIGLEGRSLRRNAPSLYNVVLKKLLFHDGRETDLGAQVWGPLLASDEMGNRAIGPLLDRLRKDAFYSAAFDSAFPGEGVTMTSLGRAIAAYEATLRIGDGRVDHALFGREKSALTAQEWRGYEIFVSKGCISCHAIGDGVALFTDQSWHNTGVAFARPRAATARVELAPGVFQTVALSSFGFGGSDPRSDLGRFEITGDPSDRWAFVTPMLRGVKDTAPYMHDGSIKTLEEVIEFYAAGGGANPELDSKIKPLDLDSEDKAALVAFLKAL